MLINNRTLPSINLDLPRNPAGCGGSAIIPHRASYAEFAKVVFPVLRKNSAKTKDSKQAFVGEAGSVCLENGVDHLEKPGVRFQRGGGPVAPPRAFARVRKAGGGYASLKVLSGYDRYGCPALQCQCVAGEAFQSLAGVDNARPSAR